MLEFKALLEEFNAMTALERGRMIQGGTAVLSNIGTECRSDKKAAEAFARFLISALITDGRINEKEYSMMYPSLVGLFGSDFGLASLKQSVCEDSADRSSLKAMAELLRKTAAETEKRALLLCMCVLSGGGALSSEGSRRIELLCEERSKKR